MGVKERGVLLDRVVSSREQERLRVNMLLCRVSCVGILAGSSCTISMQKFEVGEMYIVGRLDKFFSLRTVTFYPL